MCTNTPAVCTRPYFFPVWSERKKIGLGTRLHSIYDRMHKKGYDLLVRVHEGFLLTISWICPRLVFAKLRGLCMNTPVEATALQNKYIQYIHVHTMYVHVGLGLHATSTSKKWLVNQLTKIWTFMWRRGWGLHKSALCVKVREPFRIIHDEFVTFFLHATVSYWGIKH